MQNGALNIGIRMDGIVLAGGKSQRMGEAKPLLTVAGKTLLEHQVELMLPHVNTLFIATHLPIDIKKTIKLEDIIEGQQGPLSGIFTVLKKSDAEAMWIMPCDSFGFTQRIQWELWQQLQSTGMDIAYIVCAGDAQPLMAVMRTSVVRDLELFLQNGGRSVLKWYATQRVCQVNWQLSDGEFFNINTPKEYQALLEALC